METNYGVGFTGLSWDLSILLITQFAPLTAHRSPLTAHRLPLTA
jgi:hypothetical protein